MSAGASIGMRLAWMQEVQITHGEVICHSIHGDTHRHPWLHAEYTPSMEIKMKSDNFERKLQRMKNNSNLRSMLLMDLHRVG